MPRTRIRCPLCGALAWESNFEKGPHPLRAMAMRGKGKTKGFAYSKVVNTDFLYRMQDYLIERTKALYKFLTGVDIDELEETLGGELERLRLKSASIRLVNTSSTWKMEPQLSRRKTSALSTGNPARILTKNMMPLLKIQPAQSLSQNPSSKILRKAPTSRLVE